MDALILAAGFGSRMGDLTEKTPKPLLSVNQKPLIIYAIELCIPGFETDAKPAKI